MKKALITGINGQDGSYLAELLLNKGYEVHGTIRRTAIENMNRMVNINHIKDKIHLHICPIDNHLAIYKLIAEIKPDECYHLAAASFVSYSFEDESSIITSNFNSTHFFLSSIKELAPACKFYFAGSSEMFGYASTYPQNENEKFNPRSIYGISKVASYHVVKNYRERFNLFACTGITYNHESPRRDYAFVTRKITSAVAKIYLGYEKYLELGNIDTQRDWGYAPEYVEAMWRMLNSLENADDYVISTGRLHSVKDVLNIAFSTVNLQYQDYLKINQDFFRPGERTPLVGEFKKIKECLGWRPKKEFHKIIQEMVLNDIEILRGKSI